MTGKVVKMQAYRFVFTFFLLALGGDLAFSNPLNQPYEEGIRYKNVGQYQKAIASFEKVLKDAEADIDKSLLAETYYQIASTNHILEDYDEAISSYKKAIVLNPNSVLYYNAIGISYSELKKYKEAIAAYEKAIELTPKNAQPYYNMGLVYLKQGHFALAKDAFYKAINADKDWGEPFIGLGEILLKQGHLEGAERAYLVAEHFSPNGINILLGLGKVYARQKRFELAIEKVKKVIRHYNELSVDFC